MNPAVSSDALKAVRRIEITAGRLVSELFAGRYHSTFKGRGLEFAEVREYEPGDDVRDIDWNVTARRGHPYVKRFTEERELTVMFLVDASRSQEPGSRGRTKARLAAEVAAVLALAALKNNDKAGLLLFTDRVEKHLRPRKTRSHVLRLVREALTHVPQGRGTSLSAALTELVRVQRRRAVVFLISDFLDRGFEKPLRIAARRHDLVAVGIADPWEEAPPRGARILVEDAETGGAAALPAVPAAGTGGRWDALERSLRRAGAESILLRTDRSYVPPLLNFFQRRERRGR
jgi:uncharacterized protein (DUF58 family)